MAIVPGTGLQSRSHERPRQWPRIGLADMPSAYVIPLRADIPPNVDWVALKTLAKAATFRAARAWVRTAQVSGRFSRRVVTIPAGGLARGPEVPAAGSLPPEFGPPMDEMIFGELREHAGDGLARAIALGVASVWEGWAAGYSYTADILNDFEARAYRPGITVHPSAVSANIATQAKTGSSTDERLFQSSSLLLTIRSNLGPALDNMNEVIDLVAWLAFTFSAQAIRFYQSVSLNRIMGTGVTQEDLRAGGPLPSYYARGFVTGDRVLESDADGALGTIWF